MQKASQEPVNEYEREPVPEHARLVLKNFLGQFAGEHVAGTELMIGPLFLAHGVGALHLILGLLIGNLAAVLSWTFLTAPIATRARLTLYYQLEKICGRSLVTNRHGLHTQGITEPRHQLPNGRIRRNGRRHVPGLFGPGGAQARG